MRFNRFLRGVAPVVLMAAAGAMVSGCKADFNVTGFEGVPLADLDMSGDAPDEIVLAGPDEVIITTGEDFTISLQGDDDVKDMMRFKLEDGELAIGREKSNWSAEGTATVNVTMPAPKQVTIAGSGRITVEELAQDTEIGIAGSGHVSAPNIAVESLEVNIAGSGAIEVGGTAKEMELSIAGSGDAQMADLMVEDAEIDIAGSGNAIFSSDGTVDAHFAGSGNVTVRGSANCSVQSFGSGTLNCEPRTDSANDDESGDDAGEAEEA